MAVITRRTRRKNNLLFTDRTLHRLAFKSSVALLVILTICFQLFGDRSSLWESGTYLAMTLIAYDLWYRSDRFFLDLRKKRQEMGIDDDDDTNSHQASAYNLKVKEEQRNQ